MRCIESLSVADRHRPSLMKLLPRQGCHSGLRLSSWAASTLLGHPRSYTTAWLILSINLSHLFAFHLPRIQLLLTWRDTRIFDNCGMIATLIIHWLGPPLVLCGVPKPRLRAIWRGVLKADTRNTPLWQRSSDLRTVDCRCNLFTN